MKLRAELTDDKLRGGYYTPATLVRHCWRRALELCNAGSLRVLEPAAGDGAFLALDETTLPRIASVDAIELIEEEAAKARSALAGLGLKHHVHSGSFLAWTLETTAEFDVAVGNPPFLRYQFISADDAAAIVMLGHRLGVRFEGVSNLWIPILLGALDRLRIGGAAAFVVPAEIFHGVSAGTVRRWLLENTEGTTVDLFQPGSFPGVLQEVAILSCRKSGLGHGSREVQVVQHGKSNVLRTWSRALPAATSSWMGLLLTPEQAGAVDEARDLTAVRQLREVARLQVSIVTGANGFFCVSENELEQYRLRPWAVPLLPRSRNAPGLVWRGSDQRAMPASTKSWLLDFSEDRPSPLRTQAARRYLELGQSLGIEGRYKCRIRSPWYRVPEIWAGDLLLSKRSHRYPRLLLNKARSVTTDTIYRGRVTRAYRGRERELVASFHNSLTLLSCELEGRSFGGGVHEMVPTEISRVLVPMVSDMAGHLDRLDGLARVNAFEDALIDETDRLLGETSCGLTNSLVVRLADARMALVTRRLDRNGASEHRDLTEDTASSA